MHFIVCPLQDSNLHTTITSYQFLRLTCLPISPKGHYEQYVRFELTPRPWKGYMLPLTPVLQLKRFGRFCGGFTLTIHHHIEHFWYSSLQVSPLPTPPFTSHPLKLVFKRSAPPWISIGPRVVVLSLNRIQLLTTCVGIAGLEPTTS